MGVVQAGNTHTKPRLGDLPYIEQFPQGKESPRQGGRNEAPPWAWGDGGCGKGAEAHLGLLDLPSQIGIS